MCISLLKKDKKINLIVGNILQCIPKTILIFASQWNIEFNNTTIEKLKEHLKSYLSTSLGGKQKRKPRAKTVFSASVSTQGVNYVITLGTNIDKNCFINSSGVVRTENTCNILGSRSDLMMVTLPNNERPRQFHNRICVRMSCNLL